MPASGDHLLKSTFAATCPPSVRKTAHNTVVRRAVTTAVVFLPRPGKRGRVEDRLADKMSMSFTSNSCHRDDSPRRISPPRFLYLKLCARAIVYSSFRSLSRMHRDRAPRISSLSLEREYIAIISNSFSIRFRKK